MSIDWLSRWILSLTLWLFVSPLHATVDATRINSIQLPGIPGQIDNVYGPSNRAYQ